jgi:hypothetical protein
MKGAQARPEDVVVQAWLPWWGQWLATALAAVFLVLMGLSTVIKRPPQLLFTQLTALFPKASEYSFEYRVEGWICGENRFRELDYRRWFPMRTGDKENRFQRLGYFYMSRPSRPVLRALDAWLVEHHNAEAAPGDGIDAPIGGIQLMSLRLPIPPVGGELERYRWKPLAEIPESQRKIWYYTPVSTRKERCKKLGRATEPPPPPPQPTSEKEPAAPETEPE